MGRGRPAIFKSPGAFQGLCGGDYRPPRPRGGAIWIATSSLAQCSQASGQRWPTNIQSWPRSAATPCRSTLPTLLQRRHHSVTSHRCSISLPMVSSVRIEGDDPSGATRPALRPRSDLSGGDNGITGTELMQVPSRFRRTYLNRSSEGSGQVNRGSPEYSSACAKRRFMGDRRSWGMSFLGYVTKAAVSAILIRKAY